MPGKKFCQPGNPSPVVWEDFSMEPRPFLHEVRQAQAIPSQQVEIIAAI